MSVEQRIELLPPITEINRPYWDGARAGELRLQVCDSCGKPRFPDAPLCPHCLASESHWQAMSGRGRVWSWITMHQNYLPAFTDQLPYIVLLVVLDEGPRMMCGLAGDSAGLAIDKPVEVVFESLNDERVIPMFRLAA